MSPGCAHHHLTAATGLLAATAALIVVLAVGAPSAGATAKPPPSTFADAAAMAPDTVREQTRAQRRLDTARERRSLRAMIARGEALTRRGSLRAGVSAVDSWTYWGLVPAGVSSNLAYDLWWVAYWMYSTRYQAWYVIWEHWWCLAGVAAGCQYAGPWYWSTYVEGRWWGPFGPYNGEKPI